ncbi:protein EcsC [Salipiger sp. IMCC34102]|uniref:EcsC family protein n=1 Tax=Salipiger sp. IMCC34102 TaxID=2510647 RepID=UPI00101CEBE3|nr:EcsC family protein [Salipiger sp. IMCC34102]RYH01116.1 protein EcsC [Salipiger sp. IMCC34102]
MTPIDADDYEPLTQEVQTDVQALARRQQRANGVLMRAINFVGGQVDDTLKLLPKGARGQIDSAARHALQRSFDVAARSREGFAGQAVRTDAAHKALATLSGALGGVGGLPTALAELPVATTMIFRAVQGVAESYGEDPLSPETRLACLGVFGAGDVAGDMGVDTAFIGARLGLTGAAVHGLIARVAPKFAAVLTQKLATQALPLIGAAAGAGTNYAFTQYYVEMAHVHFGLRKLARQHGEEKVLDQFHAALNGTAAPVVRQG